MAANSILTSRTLEWLHGKGLCTEPTVATLTSQGYQHLTSIQLLAIPSLIAKKDTFIHARTGSGKTLAFLLPTLERLKAMGFERSHGVGALVISPTRELALQITQVAQPLVEAHGFTTATMIGGQKIKSSTKEEGCMLMVGTPATLTRILATARPDFRTEKLKILILDEADRLLCDEGHLSYLRRIFTHLPIDKVQKILVSATVSPACLKVAQEVLKAEFSYVTSEKKISPTTVHVKQRYLLVKSSERLSMLITVLQTLKEKKAIVFFSTCDAVLFHEKVLKHFNLPIISCNGQLPQKKRTSRYKKFRVMKHGILLTTGMADRGWDVPGVHWIIQYDPPHNPEDYIHRVGRTARGEGQTGKALLFLRPEEIKYISILNDLKVKANQIEFQGDLHEIQKQVVSLVSENHDIKQLAKMAYRQFLRSYKCHEVKKAFNIRNLDIPEVWQAFGFTEDPKCVNRNDMK